MAIVPERKNISTYYFLEFFALKLFGEICFLPFCFVLYILILFCMNSVKFLNIFTSFLRVVRFASIIKVLDEFVLFASTLHIVVFDYATM